MKIAGIPLPSFRHIGGNTGNPPVYSALSNTNRLPHQSRDGKIEESLFSSSVYSDPDRRPLIFFWDVSEHEPPTSANILSTNSDLLKKETKYTPKEIQRKGKVHQIASSCFTDVALDLSVKGNNKLQPARIFARDTARRRPVVYERVARRLVRQFELLSDYEKLVRDLGHMPIPVSVLQSRESLPPFRKEFTTLGDYLTYVRQSPEYASQYYLQQVNLTKYLPQLIQASGIAVKAPHTLSRYIRSKNCNGPTLFIGAKGTRTSLHCDRCNDNSNTSSEIFPDDSPSNSPKHSLAAPPATFFNEGVVGGSVGGVRRKPSTVSSSASTATFTTSSSLFSSLSSLSSPSIISPSSSHSTFTTSSVAPPQYTTGTYNTTSSSSSATSGGTSSSRVTPPSPSPKNDIGKHNLFLQLSGSRRFILFPDECSEDLLPSKGTPWANVSKSMTFVHSVLEYSSDFDLQIQYIHSSPFPSLAKAWPHRVEVVLEAGEALLIPAKWWHCTEILTSGTALNWWFLVDEELEGKIVANTQIIEIPDLTAQIPPNPNPVSSNSHNDVMNQSSHSLISNITYNTGMTSVSDRGREKENLQCGSNRQSDWSKRSGATASITSGASVAMSGSGETRRKVVTDWDCVDSSCKVS